VTNTVRGYIDEIEQGVFKVEAKKSIVVGYAIDAARIRNSVSTLKNDAEAQIRADDAEAKRLADEAQAAREEAKKTGKDMVINYDEGGIVGDYQDTVKKKYGGIVE